MRFHIRPSTRVDILIFNYIDLHSIGSNKFYIKRYWVKYFKNSNPNVNNENTVYGVAKRPFDATVCDVPLKKIDWRTPFNSKTIQNAL